MSFNADIFAFPTSKISHQYCQTPHRGICGRADYRRTFLRGGNDSPIARIAEIGLLVSGSTDQFERGIAANAKSPYAVANTPR